MSSGLECHIYEIEKGVWWYLLEDWDAPKNTWDWREFSTAYGPFDTEDEAYEHLCANHSNPGGHAVIPFEEGFTPDKVLSKRIEIAQAEAEAQRSRRSAFRRY